MVRGNNRQQEVRREIRGTGNTELNALLDSAPPQVLAAGLRWRRWRLLTSMPVPS